jgi:hypothetical protein
MENSWMIFAHEGNANHMWYCGNDHYVDLETGEQAWDMDMDQLHEILHNKRKKHFTDNKTRYVIVARGTRYEP